MFEDRTDPANANYPAAIWYGIHGAMKYLIEMNQGHRLDKPYDTPRSRARLEFFERQLATMPQTFREAVEQERRRLPSPECSGFVEIEAAENVAGIVLAGGTLCTSGEDDFEIVGYNDMIEASSYDMIANLSCVTIAYDGQTPEQRQYSARHRREWQAHYRAHLRTIAMLLQKAGVTLAADLIWEAA